MAKAEPLSGPDIRGRRLLFRCWHRGTQENDLILGAFAETSLAPRQYPARAVRGFGVLTALAQPALPPNGDAE